MSPRPSCPEHVLAFSAMARAGVTTSMGIKLQFPPESGARAGQSYNAGELALIILAFGAASFVCGFVLTLRQDVSSSAHICISLKTDYPSTITWRLQHQAILSMCLASLCASYGIAHAFTGANKNYVNSIGLQCPATRHSSSRVCSTPLHPAH